MHKRRKTIFNLVHNQDAQMLRSEMHATHGFGLLLWVSRKVWFLFTVCLNSREGLFLLFWHILYTENTTKTSRTLLRLNHLSSFVHICSCHVNSVWSQCTEHHSFIPSAFPILSSRLLVLDQEPKFPSLCGERLGCVNSGFSLWGTPLSLGRWTIQCMNVGTVKLHV